jgi:hypothetical protein
MELLLCAAVVLATHEQGRLALFLDGLDLPAFAWTIREDSSGVHNRVGQARSVAGGLLTFTGGKAGFLGHFFLSV